MRSISRVLGPVCSASFMSILRESKEVEFPIWPSGLETAVPRNLLSALGFYFAIERGHADVQQPGGFLTRAFAMRQCRFDVAALLLLNEFIETLSNRHRGQRLIGFFALRLAHDVGGKSLGKIRLSS